MDGINKSKRSLREVLPRKVGPARSQQAPHDHAFEGLHDHQEGSAETERGAYVPPRPPRSKGNRKFLWGAGSLALLIAFFFVSSLFAQATVKVTPRQGKIILSGSQEARRQQSDGGLTFQLMSFTDTASKVAKATGTEHVERKASGQITIYNAFSTDPQELVVNTRFEAPNGKVYRIQSAVTVPGATQKGGELVPGSTEATVLADQPGADYNLDQAEFKIPGFKGSPRYDKFYARTKGAISGGFSGESKSVSADEQAKIRAELQGILKDQIIKNARLQLPADFILYDDAVFITFSQEMGTSTTAADEVELKEKAVLTGVIFNTKELSRYYALTQVADYHGEEILISNPEELQFKLENKESLNPNDLQRISFTLEGNAHIVWSYDAEDLKSRLRAAPDKDYQAVFAKYPAIEKAEVIFRPPWIREFPEDQNRMKIVTNLTK